MQTLLIIAFLIFGLIIGSFLNVFILRYNTKKSLSGRSACMSCSQKLFWYDLVPILSFLILRGRCRSCQTRISWQYPLVEFFTGVIFIGLFIKFRNIFYTDIFSFALSYTYYTLAFSALLVIAVYDLRHKIIPDALALFFGVVSFAGIFLFLDDKFFPHLPSLWAMASGVVIAVPFAVIWFVSKGAWMGLGDAKLMLGLGWLLGFSRILSGVVIGFWSGAIFGLALIFTSGKYSLKSEIPFAPFLVLGAMIAFMFDLHIFPIGWW